MGKVLPAPARGPRRRRPRHVATMRRAGQVVAEILERLSAAARPGASTASLEHLARQILDEREATANFAGYNGYPAAICTSVNDVVAHGLPGPYRLVEGDIVSLDCGAAVAGFHADASVTVAVGAASADATRLIDATRACLAGAIAVMEPGRHLHEVGRTIQSVAAAAGLTVVPEYAGHAIGRALHEDPKVFNYWPGYPGPVLEPGMVFAVEPMLSAGSPATRVHDDGWSVVTGDGALAAHFGHNVVITADGPEILTRP
ncbi:MAG: type I methionyl aminopeptidase [Acidimicrobiales bacterium]